ncbi:ScbA/BarX family gamma-butyrolactone biosynthesis protein [Actinacidiphila yeochonensis]|uniref:ScbA/BarX family gamma-butyrolactone biosynthesis protein n=1 Tax=Actinacidiphila yeochonensis TaxID=89050 RepID=UPI0007C703AF|nr:ScbA/BarX family gamma-butyrolactone biosynthesis protein [Actinacidiphila yeochonensis]
MTNTVGAPPAPGRRKGLSWSRTVPRELVHRTSVAEVLLTDVRRTAAGMFEAAACWPRSHSTFPADGSDLHSPLLVVETLRQLGIYLPLRWFGVSPAAHMVIADVFFALMAEREPRAGHGGSEVACTVAVGGVRRHADGSLAGLRLDVEFRAHGRAFARAGGGARFLAPDRYAAVRAGRFGALQPPPGAGGRPHPDLLAVSRRADVVVSRRAGVLVVDPADPRHPFYFDHPSDHVPGMVLLEAARQAAAEASGGTLLRPTSGRLVAEHFTEYLPAARVEAVPHHHTCVFRVRQGTARTAYGVLGYGF